jgi:predicted RNA-binding protein YlxR (DUF448 family)
MRSCVVTREKLAKKDLLRIVKNKEGKVSIDLTGKANGHGAYIKKTLDTLQKAEQNKILERLFEITIPKSLYEEIENIIKE